MSTILYNGKANRLMEHRGQLSRQAALGYMLGDNVIAMPKIRQASKAKDGPYCVVLKRLDNGCEYMHPTPLDSLNNWHLYFIDCELLQDVGVTKDTEFPKLFAPGESETFTSSQFPVNMYVLRARVWRAPANSDLVRVAAKAPFRIPRTNAKWTKRVDPSEKRVRLIQAGLLALGSARGFEIDATKGGIGKNVTDDQLLERLSLEHGIPSDMIDDEDRRDTLLVGEMMLTERENTAGTLTIPATLGVLYFLQPLQEEAVQYHILAISKYAYFARLSSVGGGWDVLVMVNVRANFEEVMQLFLQQPISNVPLTAAAAPLPSPCNGQSSANNEAFDQLVNAGIDMLNTTYGFKTKATKTDMERDNLTKDEFFGYLQLQGLLLLHSELVQQGELALKHKHAAEGRLFTKWLLQPQKSTSEQIGRAAFVLFLLCQGALREVWQETDSGKAFKEAIKANEKKNVPPLDRHKLRIVCQHSWLVNQHPMHWWEALCSAMGNISAASLCATILYRKKDSLSLLFMLSDEELQQAHVELSNCKTMAEVVKSAAEVTNFINKVAPGKQGGMQCEVITKGAGYMLLMGDTASFDNICDYVKLKDA